MNTIAQLIATRARELPEKIFLYFQQLEISYQALDEITSRVARGLLSLGLQPGDKICLMLPNCAEYVYLFLGAPRAGLTVVPINTALKREEVAYIATDSDARAIIATANFLEMVKSLKPASDNGESELLIIEVGALDQSLVGASDQSLVGEAIQGKRADQPQVAGSGELPIAFNRLMEASSEAIDLAAAESLVSIVYTSGTTGKPKGVMLTHANYLANSADACAMLQLREDDRAMCILPLFHVNGQVATILAPIQRGASLILTEGFSPKNFFDNVARYRATLFSGVPTIYSILLHLPERASYDLSSLRICVCGAAPMPVELFNSFEQAFNTVIIEGYGLTEGTCVSTLNPVNGERKTGSIGLTLPNQEVKIFDDQDREVAVGEIGEIVVRGSNVMSGYYQNPTATAETLRNGWLHTGDLGKQDADGYCYIVGRKKEMIIRGGENIYPKEIEEALYRHPLVKEAAVMGLPDRIWGEEVGAVLVLKDGAQTSADDIIAYCREHLADYKCPRRIFFCEQFPKTATGKIQKSKLVEQLIAE